jgi:peptide/nickel transport system substrate-binding protein
MRPWHLGIMLLLVLLCVPPGAAVSGPATRSELRIAVGTDAEIFDPHNYRSGYDLLLHNLITDTLIGADPDMRPVPRLATSWQQVNDVTWRFRLRAGVTFHDGTPLDAEAVKFNYERAAKALKGSRFYGEIKEIRVVDPLTVEFVLNRPFAPFFLNLTMPVGGLISPAFLKRGADPTRMLVGTGPFVLSEWVPNERIVLVRNDKYWGRAPRVQRVIFRRIREESTRQLALLRREVDVAQDPPAFQTKSLRESMLFDLITEPQARILWVGFNFKDSVVRDRRVREAVALAIDRKAIVEQALEGVPREATVGIIPPEVLRTQPALRYEYSPDRARRALAEAGHTSGLRLSLWSPQGRYFGDKTIMETVQAQLGRVGITAAAQIMEYGAYVDAVNRHEQQLWIIGWGFTPHPDAMLRGVFHSRSAANWTAYTNAEFDRLLEAAVSITDRPRMAEAYWRIQKLLMDDIALVPIYYAVNVYAANKKVRNFRTHPMELIDLSETWVEE